MAFRRQHLVPCQPDSAYEQFLVSRVDIVANKFAKEVWNGEYANGNPFQVASELQAFKNELETVAWVASNAPVAALAAALGAGVAGAPAVAI